MSSLWSRGWMGARVDHEFYDPVARCSLKPMSL